MNKNRLKQFLKIVLLTGLISLALSLAIGGFRQDLIKFDVLICFICPAIAAYFMVYVFKITDGE